MGYLADHTDKPKAETTEGDFAPLPPEHQKTVDRMYDNNCGAPEERWSLEGAMRDTLRESSTKLSDRLGWGVEQQAAYRHDVAETLTEAGLHQTLEGAELVTTLHTDALMAIARPGGDELDVEAQIAADIEASNQAEREYWGAAYAEDLGTRRVKYVRAHPKLKAMLEVRGIGVKPAVVRFLNEFVRDSNFR